MSKHARSAPYADEVHAFALRHVGLIKAVALSRARPSHCYRDMDDLKQEAYIAILSAAEEVVAGTLPESDFARVAANRMKDRVNKAANRCSASITTPWYVVARIWNDMKHGREASFPVSVPIFDERLEIVDEFGVEASDSIEEIEWLRWAIESALSKMRDADAGILRAYYGIGRDAVSSREIADGLGITRARVNQIVQEARDRIRPILREIVESDR